jgi:hypothetical protein
MRDLSWVKKRCQVVDVSDNEDQSIDRTGLGQVMNGAVGQHTAALFCGLVWYEDGQFHEQVWKNALPIAEYSDTDYATLRDRVNAEHGWL